MLVAPIIYIPGTGGNFLYRVLTLSEKTAFGDSVDTAELNYNHHVATLDRLAKYNTWNSEDWKGEELKYNPAYKTGTLEFHNYETTTYKIIDPWHPSEFYDHDQNSKCWEKGAWPNYIFIQTSDRHKTFLLNNQTTKQYNLDWQTQTTCMQQLKTQYQSQSIDIDFDDFFDQQQFLSSVGRVDRQLELSLDFDLVKIMWQKWYVESQKIWKK
jgi:hypothetical protein